MGIPLRQAVRVGAYLVKQKLARRDKFALTLELEPLFACNLACAGCGKIQHPASVLKQRMPVEQAVAENHAAGNTDHDRGSQRDNDPYRRDASGK